MKLRLFSYKKDLIKDLLMQSNLLLSANKLQRESLRDGIFMLSTDFNKQGLKILQVF